MAVEMNEANVLKLATLGFFETSIVGEGLDYAYIGNNLIHYKSKAKIIGYIQFMPHLKGSKTGWIYGILEYEKV